LELEHLLDSVVKLLDDKKAENINVMDVSPATNIADYFVICTANSPIHADALISELEDWLDVRDIEYHSEGDPTSWKLIDIGPIIVHIFTPEARDYYKLEEFWDKMIRLAEHKGGEK